MDDPLCLYVRICVYTHFVMHQTKYTSPLPCLCQVHSTWEKFKLSLKRPLSGSGHTVRHAWYRWSCTSGILHCHGQSKSMCYPVVQGSPLLVPAPLPVLGSLPLTDAYITWCILEQFCRVNEPSAAALAWEDNLGVVVYTSGVTSWSCLC